MGALPRPSETCGERPQDDSRNSSVGDASRDARACVSVDGSAGKWSLSNPSRATASSFALPLGVKLRVSLPDWAPRGMTCGSAPT